MATVPINFYEAAVFGPQNQHAISSLNSNQRTDVFAGQERRASAVADQCRPRRIKVRIPLGIETVELACFDSDLPAWARPVIASLPERWGRTPGWDGYRAIPTNVQLVARLLNVLSIVMREGFPPPEITPLADGGVQAEWHRLQKDLEVVVRADDAPSYYFYDHASGEEQTGTFESNEGRVRDLIGGLD